LITYFGETIRHNMVVVPLPIPPELGLNKVLSRHIESIIIQLIEMVDINKITNSQLGEILAIVKVISDDLEWKNATIYLRLNLFFYYNNKNK
jgi:hypothetical protein